MRFPNDKEVVFVDTVGFIRELPKELVSAFRATLEEAAQSDMLIHVIDCADEERANNIVQVEAVLKEIVEEPIART